MEDREDVLRKLQENSDLFGGDSSSDSGSEENDSPALPQSRAPAITARPECSSKRISPQLDSEDEEIASKSQGKRTKSKTPNSSHQRKSSKVEVKQIHSDSQRIVRQSSLNLPQYQTRTKTLDTFLTKLKSKKAEITSAHQACRISNKENIQIDHTPLASMTKSGSSSSRSVSPDPLSSAYDGGMPQKGEVHHDNSNDQGPPPTEMCNANPPVAADQRKPAQLVKKSAALRQTQRTLTSLFAKPCPPLPEQSPEPDSTQVIPPPRLPLANTFHEEDGLCLDIPSTRELTPLEKFQQRLTRHIVPRSSQVQERPFGSIQAETSILPEKSVAKLKDKPGAMSARVEWKLAMRRQVSQISQTRAQEQKALELSRKMYDEEEEEEEVEMTDAETTDTSDEEFEGDGGGGDAEESDVCSDLDEDEAENGRDSGEALKDASDNEDDMDDEDSNNLKLTKKKRRLLPRVLDSDDDDGADIIDNKNVSEMPPLRLDSDEESDSSSLLPCTISADVSKPVGTSLTDSGIGTGGLDSAENLDESVRTGKVDEGECIERKGVIGVSEEGSLCSTNDADSLELSFQWGQSLPPAQPFDPMAAHDKPPSKKIFSLLRDNSMMDTQDILEGEESQWQPTLTNSTQSQLNIEGETQFLDEDGFLCIRKEKVSSPGLALQGALDPLSQEGCSGELLQLCSGKFPGTPPSPRDMLEKNRHSSDSQEVRELLGLPTEAEPRMGIGLDSQDDGLSEVIGLCSGGFPLSQMPPPKGLVHTGCCLTPSKGAGKMSDGMSSESSDEEEGEEENAVLRWAKRHQQESRTGAAAPPEGGVSGHTSEEEDGDMPLIRRRKVYVKPTKEERMAEFVESEAELSGEDVGSDEEDEDDEEDLLLANEYEEDEGVELELSKSELWDQVNKAHLKHALADDKAELQDFKERFLKEGDLYEDGLALKNGFFRTRRFAGQGSEAGSLELFSEERESEGEELEDSTNSINQAEAKRRRDRLEREEFIRKCKENEENLLLELDQDSQTILSIITDTTSQSRVDTPISGPSKRLPPSSTSFPKAGHLSTGNRPSYCNSFLKQTKSSTTPSSLHRSNSQTATPSVTTPTNVGSNSSHGFVFQKATPASHTNNVLAGKKRSTTNTPHGAPTPPLVAKKSRINKLKGRPRSSSLDHTSIFNLY